MIIPVFPRVSLAGTHGPQLLEDYVAAADALKAARTALIQTAPHGRDYIHPNRDTFFAAVKQHVYRMQMLEKLINEIDEIAINISNQLP